MRRYWLIFAQAVTVCLAILFVVSTLRPQWVGPQVVALPEAGVAPAPIAIPGGAVNVTSYASAVALAAPSVVNVYTTKTVNLPSTPLPGDPILRQYLGQMPDAPRHHSSTSLGSGVIINAEGYVLTNYHVVEAADSIEVALADGRALTAKVVGADPETDLAVLKLPETDAPLPLATLARNRESRVGDVVLAIGNPFGVGQTTTQGIISALGRNRLGINTYENFIQTDAAINPGNSGGALVDTQGRVIGINTAIYSPSGGSLGIGFAIPIDAAHSIMEEIVANGSVKRGWLGVEPQDITAELMRSFKLADRQGVIIAGVIREGPAGRAGVRVGDIVIAIENTRVRDTTSMLSMIAALPPGYTAELAVIRAGKERTIRVKVGTRPTRPN